MRRLRLGFAIVGAAAIGVAACSLSLGGFTCDDGGCEDEAGPDAAGDSTNGGDTSIGPTQDGDVGDADASAPVDAGRDADGDAALDAMRYACPDAGTVADCLFCPTAPYPCVLCGNAGADKTKVVGVCVTSTTSGSACEGRGPSGYDDCLCTTPTDPSPCVEGYQVCLQAFGPACRTCGYDGSVGQKCKSGGTCGGGGMCF